MKRLHRVILLLPCAREFDRGLRRGAFEYAHKHAPWIFLEEPPAYVQSLTPPQRLKNMRGWAADGMIVPHDRLADVRSLRIPTIVINGMAPLEASYYQIVCANEEIGRLGASALMGLGLHHFGYCGLQGLEFSDGRGAGFRRAIEAAGNSASVYPDPGRKLPQSWDTEQQQLARWLSELPKPAGLMACNDDRARMLAGICWMLGIHVPDELAILGVDNDEQVCQSAYPPLSSLALATETAGYEAAACLASLMSGQTPASRLVTVLPTHLVPRQSTDILAVDDLQVSRAIRFIRENSNRNLRVADLLPVAGLSRRALQDAFVRNLGRTPREEIHLCRVDRIARLLVETNMSVGEIAEASGFEVDAHLARFFSRRAGMSPLAYRRRHRTL